MASSSSSTCGLGQERQGPGLPPRWLDPALARPHVSQDQPAREDTMRVEEMMTKQVATVLADEPASPALRLMWDCDCGVLPVLDDQGRVTAVVTDRDLAMTAMFRDLPPGALRVA